MLAAAVVLALYPAAQSLAHWLNQFDEDFSFAYTPPYIRIFPYFLGMLLGRWLLMHPKPPRPAVYGILTAVGVLGMCNSLYWRHYFPFPLQDILSLVFLALLLWSAAQTQTVFSKALAACRPLHWLGTMSFEIYLIHFPFRVAGYTVWVLLFGEGPVQAWTAFFLFAALTLALSVWAHGKSRRRPVAAK